MRITNTNRISVFIVFLLFTCNSIYSQSINELKEKKKAIEKEIGNISNLISKTEKESKESLTNIQLTKRKIELKNSLINQIESESELLKNQINYRRNIIDSLNLRIVSIKEEYKKIIIYSQKNNPKNNLLLQILSSKDFNQAYKRVKFYQQILNYKKQVAENYNSIINSVRNENIILRDNVSLLTRKQNEKENEINNLRKDEINLNNKIKKLTRTKKQLIADLEEQKRVSSRINDEIKKLIEVEAKQVKESIKSNKSVLLSNSFKENIGKFNLPIENGIVTGLYGESFHPVLKEVKIKNNGIDITISKNSDVFSIYKGEVRKVIKIPGSNLAVIIRHGSFLSVYANLTAVNVNVGQEVNTYQKIGEINLYNREETAILHFEIWNENRTEDPMKWINH